MVYNVHRCWRACIQATESVCVLTEGVPTLPMSAMVVQDQNSNMVSVQWSVVCFANLPVRVLCARKGALLNFGGICFATSLTCITL